MAMHLRLYDGAGTFVALLPDVVDADAQEELNAEGAWSARYTAGGVNAQLLDDANDHQVGIVVDGEELYRGLLEDDGDNEADPTDDVALSGRGMLAILERALVYPFWGAGTLPATNEFTEASPGNVLGFLLQQAQGRGALPGVVWNFTYTEDSAGTPWAHTITVAYDAGVTLYQVLQGLIGQGVVEARMRGMELELYVPDTVLNADRPDVVLHVGRSATSLPRQRSRRELASHVLVLGDEGKTVERSDATAEATYGRREVSYSQGNSKHTGTMNVLGDNVLKQRKRPAHGRTVEYQRDLEAEAEGAPPVPLPWTDYNVGDRIRLGHVRQADGTLEPLRVRSCAARFTADGAVDPSVELNDLFVEATVRLQRRIEGIVNGTVTTSAGGTAAPPPDTVAPGQPTSVAITSAAYLRDDGTAAAAATISWPALVANEDASVLTDLDGYLVSHRKVGAARWSGERFTSDTSLDVDVEPGSNVEARVRGRDRGGNKGAYRTSAAHLVAEDTTAPPTPSQPVAAAGPGIVRVVWDGLGSAGEAMPADLAYVEVHAKANGGTAYAPDATTLVDQLRTAGVVPLTGGAFGVPLGIRLVAVDRSGNRSAASAGVTAAPVAAVDDAYSGVLYRDQGNLVPGGRFDTAAARDRLQPLAAGWSFVETGEGWALQHDDALVGGAAEDVVRNVPAPSEGVLWLRSRVWSQLGGANDARVRVEWKDSAGAAISNSYVRSSPVDTLPAGAWATIAGQVTAPAGAATYDVAVFRTGQGRFQWRELEVRPVITTAVIGQAAVDTAQIKDLAVNNAKVVDLSVAKLTAGALLADVTLSARIATALTGARVELGAVGLRQYNAAGTLTTSLDTAGGALLTGTVSTRSTPSSTGVELTGTQLRAYYGATLMGGLGGRLDGLGTQHMYVEGIKGASGYQAPKLQLYGDWLGAQLFGDAIQLRVHTSASADKTMLAIWDGSYVDVYGVIRGTRAFLQATNDAGTGTNSGILSLGADSGLQLGLDANELMARNGSSQSTLNLNLGGPTVIGAEGQNLYVRNWPGGTGLELFRTAASAKLVLNTVGVGSMDSRQGDTATGSYGVMRASAFNVNSDSKAKRNVRPLDLPATAWPSLVGALGTWQVPLPKQRHRELTKREQQEYAAAHPNEPVPTGVWEDYAPGEAPEEPQHRRLRRGFLADKLAPELLAEPDPEHGAMIDVMATLAAVVAKVDELDRRPAQAAR